MIMLRFTDGTHWSSSKLSTENIFSSLNDEIQNHGLHNAAKLLCPQQLWKFMQIDFIASFVNCFSCIKTMDVNFIGSSSQFEHMILFVYINCKTLSYICD